MSQPNASPPQPAPALPAAPPDVAKQIADLTDAVNRLVQAQRPAPPAAAPDASFDVGGDIPGGAPLAPSVDYAKLSPVQQIALGLRDAKPVGPGRATIAAAAAPRGEDTSSNGAD